MCRYLLKSVSERQWQFHPGGWIPPPNRHIPSNLRCLLMEAWRCVHTRWKVTVTWLGGRTALVPLTAHQPELSLATEVFAKLAQGSAGDQWKSSEKWVSAQSPARNCEKSHAGAGLYAGVVTGGCWGRKVAGQSCRQFWKEIIHVTGVQRIAETNAKTGRTIGLGRSDRGWPNPTAGGCRAVGFALSLWVLPKEQPALGQDPCIRGDENPKLEPATSRPGNVRCQRQRHGRQREDNKLITSGLKAGCATAEWTWESCGMKTRVDLVTFCELRTGCVTLSHQRGKLPSQSLFRASSVFFKSWVSSTLSVSAGLLMVVMNRHHPAHLHLLARSAAAECIQSCT